MDKVIVITGGTKGLGKKLSELFLKDDSENHKIIVIGREIDSQNNMQYACDISDELAVKSVFEDIIKRFGRIDLLVNNAGYGLSGITELIKTEDAKKIFDVNFFGAWYCTKYALPHMQKGARIVNISSAMDFFPVPYRGFYASSKSALSTLSLSQRMECEKIGVDITLVSPGDVKTTFTKNRVKDSNTNERYGDDMKNATKKVDSRENKRMDANIVARKIYKICLKKKTKPMYIIGFKYKFLYFVSKFFPLSWKLRVISKVC